MPFSTRANRLLAGATPVAVGLLVAGTILLIATDAGGVLLVLGLFLLVGGVAAVHSILARRYGGLGFAAFVLTELSFLLIAVYGLGFVTLAAAGPLLALALVRMRPRLRLTAAALVAVWPLAVVVAAASPLVFVEAIGTLFAIPYAVLAVAALRLQE